MKNGLRSLLLPLCLGAALWASPSGSLALPHRDFVGIPMIDVASLSNLPGAKVRWYPVSETMLLRVEQDPAVEIRFNAGVPFAVIKGETVALPVAPQRENDAFWVPRIPVVRALDSLLPGEFSWKEESGELAWAPEKDLVGMTFAPSDSGTAVELRFTRKMRYEKFFTRPRFLLRLADAVLPVDTLPRKFTTGQIRNIGAIQEPKSAQLSFEVNHLVGDVEVTERDEGRTLVVFFRRPGEAKKAAPAPVPAGKGKKVHTVIIDPGHGGKDSGALGLKAKEKDLTLAVGKKLRAELEKRGYAVRMTRDSDVFITLKQRPELASKWKGDLFVSLHCDAIAGDATRKAQTKGFKAFILREAESEEDKAIARRENKFIDEASDAGARRELSPVEWILLEHQLNLYTKESEEFAYELVQSLAVESVPIPKNGSGAGQAGFYVLVGAFMPAVLLEMGFISNPAEEKYMASEAGQDELAAKIADGIDRYRAK